MRVRPRWSVEQDRAVGVSGKGPRPAELGRRILGVAALTGGVLLSVLAPTAQAAFTERVSVSSAGAEANASGSQGERISADGRYIVFTSDASNLVAGDTNSAWDIFVRDRESGETRRVSVSSSGAEGKGNSYSADVSADGRYVCFSSTASNLVAGDTNNATDIFVYDVQSGETRRVSVSSTGTEADRASREGPSISADGRYVAFTSAARNLIADDTNTNTDIFVHDLQSGETQRVSVKSSGAPITSDSGIPASAPTAAT
jgi:Tol biopolymer transport system component